MARFTLAIWLGVLTCMLPVSATAAETDVGPSIFEDTPETLVTERGEFDEDRIQAAALFTEGRLLFRRQDFNGALQRYQRAWRLDPDAVSILREIVDLAFSLRRSLEGARYAVIAAEKSPSDPTFMRRLAKHLTQQGELDRAAGLYEKSFQLETGQPIRADGVLMRMEAGRLYLLTKRYEQSADAFGVVVDAINNPDKYGITEKLRKSLLDKEDQQYALFGEAFRMAGRMDRAVAMFEKAHQASPDKGLLELRLAHVAEKQDDTDKALTHLENAFSENVKTTTGQQYDLLLKLLTEKEDDEAKVKEQLIKRLATLYAANSEDELLGYYLADAYRESDQLDKAEAIYRKQLDQKPALDGYIGLIDVYRRRKQIPQLADILGEALVAAGSFQQLEDDIKNIVADQGLVGDYLAHVSKRADSDATALGDGVALAAALVALKSDKIELGEKFFEAALEAKKPDKRQAATTWGLELLMDDQNEPAARVFRRGLDAGWFPDDDPDFYYYLATALESAGETEAAIAAAQKIADLQPDSARYQSRLPYIMYRAKRYDAAEKGYLELLKKFDSDYQTAGVRETMREARFILSNIAVHQKRSEAAEEWLAQVLDEFPEDIGALNDLGYLWADRGKHLHRALGMVQRAVQAEPENIAYLDSLGWAYYRLGRYQEAVAALEKATAGDEPDGVILDHLGDAYLKANMQEKALESWRQAVQRMEDDSDQEKRDEIKLKIKQHSAE